MERQTGSTCSLTRCLTRPFRSRIELARVHLALAVLAGARTLMREVDELFKRRPDLGTLTGEAAALRAQLARQRGTVSAGVPALAAAELRLLPLLPTHLSFAEIAAELFVSTNTAKTPAVSICRKLAPAPAARRPAGPGSWACWKAGRPIYLFIGDAPLFHGRDPGCASARVGRCGRVWAMADHRTE